MWSLLPKDLANQNFFKACTVTSLFCLGIAVGFTNVSQSARASRPTIIPVLSYKSVSPGVPGRSRRPRCHHVKTSIMVISNCSLVCWRHVGNQESTDHMSVCTKTPTLQAIFVSVFSIEVNLLSSFDISPSRKTPVLYY